MVYRDVERRRGCGELLGVRGIESGPQVLFETG
jgi:hypothetical protein